MKSVSVHHVIYFKVDLRKKKTYERNHASTYLNLKDYDFHIISLMTKPIVLEFKHKCTGTVESFISFFSVAPLIKGMGLCHICLYKNGVLPKASKFKKIIRESNSQNDIVDSLYIWQFD